MVFLDDELVAWEKGLDLQLCNKVQLHALACCHGWPPKVPDLAQVMEELMADKALGAKLAAPSISHGSQNLYMRGVLEEATRENLAKARAPDLAPAPVQSISGGGSACVMIWACRLVRDACITRC